LVKSIEKWLNGYQQVKQYTDELNLAFEYYKENLVSEEEVDTDYEKAVRSIEDLELKNMLRKEEDSMDAVMKINSGAGGTESQDWAQMLMRMYMRWCEAKGYKVTITDLQDGDEAGIKSVTMTIEGGEYAYGFLKSENGVHRLVRVSPYNAQGKRMTSFASVFVSPLVDDTIEIYVDPAKVSWDTFRSSGAGGQNVNKVESGVRLRYQYEDPDTGEKEENSRKLNEDALNKANEVRTQIALTTGDYVSQGFYTCTLIVDGDSIDEVEERVDVISKTINNMGFITIEESINSVEAFLGSIPGNITNNVRMPILNTITLSHLLPVSSVWGGDSWNKHLNAPPLIYTKTKGSTPFRFNIHIEDIGHSAIVGPTGYGKSVLLGLIASSFMKYKDSRVYFFDKDASSRVLTYAVGGEFHDLGNDELSFQPLANIEIVEEKEWAYGWILEILEQENIKVSPTQKEKIWKALDNLAKTPIELRTISNFYTSVNDREIKEALIPYKIGGALGKYFDSDKDTLNFSRWQVFEMNQVINNKKGITPLLSYIFRRIENSLDGSPCIIILDECWMFFDNPIFAAKIREWLKVLRKKNCSVIFATQELGDILNSKLFTTVLDACQTKVFLPNPNAFADNYIPIYQKFGLNKTEIEIISKATKKKEYYYKSTKGSRLFELDLKEKTLSLIASSDLAKQNKAKELKEIYRDANDFTREWLSYGEGI